MTRYLILFSRPPGRVRKADKEKPRLQDAGTLMKKMNREERIDFLNVYTVVELKRIAADLNIKIKSRMNKPEVIKKIADLAGTPAYTTTAAHIAAESGGGGKQAQATDRLGAAAVQVADMAQEQIVDFLRGFNKSDILEISRRLHLQIPSSNSKDNIILLIAKHLGYKDINRRMAERPRRW